MPRGKPRGKACGYFTDSFWFAEQLAHITANKTLLEIGTGTGIIALFCALAGAKVTATDINPEAIKNAEINFNKFSVDVTIKQGSIYEPITAGEKFDFIFWNHPFNNWETHVDEMLLRAGLDHNYEGLETYVKGARGHLSKNGKLLLGTGNNADLEAINAIALKYHFTLSVIAEEVMPIENGVDVVNSYIIYELVDKQINTSVS